ncbi:flagellar hook-basal body complex protein FliE [Clostridiaceae bacterium 35-E11]
MRINNVLNVAPSTLTPKEEKASSSFGDILKQSIDKVNDYQIESKKLDELAVLGEVDNIHEVMIAAEKAGIALQFTLETKNKVIEAYKEIMRLQI